MDWREHIVSDPAVLAGKPAIKGTRISVELVLGWLANGWSREMILDAYPNVTSDHFLACLAFAAERAGKP